MKMMYLVMIGIVAIMLIEVVSATSIYTNQINFQPNQSREHYQIIQVDTPSNVTVTILPFTPDWSNPVAISIGGNLSWSGVSTVEFNLSSPSNCVEGTVYKMPVYINGNLYSKFTFICVPDDKIVDYKAEYGHGDGNYLDMNYPYLPNQDISLFNLIRVYTYGSYFNPNEDGLNATIECVFPQYLVKERQKNAGTNIVQNSTNVDATFHWDNLGGNWFRLAPLEQEIKAMNVGDNYNITCGALDYYYSTGRIHANFNPISFEVRTTQPFMVNATVDTGNKGLIYRITNIEKYPIYDLNFLWTTDSDDSYYEDVKQLLPNQTVGFEVFLMGNGNLTLDASFVPVWQRSSLKPMRYSQFYNDGFYFDSGVSKIDRVADANNVIATLNNGTIQYKLTDVDEIIATRDYVVEFTTYSMTGQPLTLAVPPTIIIRNVFGTIRANAPMTLIHSGVYQYDYSTIPDTTPGQWSTEIQFNYNGNQMYAYDKWNLISNPTEINVSIVGVCLDMVVADISIKNEGVTPYEYVYDWWSTDSFITPVENGFASGTASKLINAGDTYVTRRNIKWNETNGNGFFKARVFYGDYSYATQSFNANTINDPTFTCGGSASVQDCTLLSGNNIGCGAGNVCNEITKRCEPTKEITVPKPFKLPPTFVIGGSIVLIFGLAIALIAFLTRV